MHRVGKENLDDDGTCCERRFLDDLQHVELGAGIVSLPKPGRLHLLFVDVVVGFSAFYFQQQFPVDEHKFLQSFLLQLVHGISQRFLEDSGSDQFGMVVSYGHMERLTSNHGENCPRSQEYLDKPFQLEFVSPRSSREFLRKSCYRLELV